MSKYVSAYNGVKREEPKKKKYVSAYSDAERNRGGLAEGAGYVAGSLGLGLAGVGEGVLDIAAASRDIMRGDTEMAKYRFLDNRTADAQQSLTEWYNPGKGMQFAGDVASGIGQSSVFLLDALVPGLGTGLFFGGITGQSVAGAAQQTGDVGLKEIGYGVASGAAEAALGKLVGAGGKVAGKLGSSLTRSTGKAVGQRGITNALTKATGKKLAGMGWNVAQNTLADAAGEFAEEFTAEYIDTGLQRLFGIDPNASTSFGEALRAGAVGFVSGAAMGAPANVYNYKNSVAAGRAIREEGGVDQLLYRAAATVDVLKEQEEQAREKGRTKATVPEDAGLVGKTTAKGKQAVANLGTKITASKAKGYWSKLEKNINAYTSMDETMRNSDVGDALLGELRGNLFFTNMSYAVEEAEEALKTATDEQITEWLVEVNDKAKKAGRADAGYTVEDFRANKDGILSTVAAAFWIDEIRRAAKGTGNAEKAAEKPTEAPTSPWDGMADEDMSGYKAAGEAENALLKAAVKESVPRGSVQAMLDEFRKGTDMTPEEFAAAWSDGVHIYGRYGFDVGEESPLSRMSPEAREAAMKFGRETEEAERKSAEEKAKAKKKPAEMAGKKGAVVRGKGLEIKTLSDEQYAAYKAAEVLAEVLGTEIVIETAITDKKGRTVNGYYDTKTNRLHVNINALRDGKNISLYTLGHEVTHYIKEWSPTKFEALADFVLEKMGVDAEEAIADKLASLKRLGVVKDTMTVAEANAMAREELVAEGMELVLTDGKVLTELAKTDKSLWEKIRDWFFDIIGQIRRNWQDLNQASKTAQVLKETVESLEEIERLFTEGVTEAGERTRTAEAGVIVDDTSGTAMLSVDDIPKTEQEIDDAVNRLVQKLGVDESRARKWVEDEISLATLILRDDMVDYAHRKADRRLTAIVKNSDYKQGTLDFSNICRKRREYTRMMQRIQQAFPNRRFTAEEFATIRKIMVDEGLEVACGLCYVEDRRQQEGYIAETFQKAVETWREGNHKTFWDSFNKKWAEYNARQIKAMNMLAKGDHVPTIADLTTVEGMEAMGKDVDKGGHPDILRAWRTFNNARGQGAARLLTNEAEYQRQILKYSKDRVKRINDLGGLRIFSFSDFEEFHLLDIIQAVQDCAAMGIKIQFYTKVPSFALLMADTKAKGNLSLIPLGDLGYEIRNGKRVLVYDPVEGIDFNDKAFKEVARGNPNIGTILVGINDDHIRTAMEDDFIDYIIPFHTGQTEVVRQIKKIGKWQNYKNEQVDKPWDSGSKAKPVNIYTDVIAAAERQGDPIRNERQFVERFLKVCEERGLRPRFSRFLNTNAEGKYVYTKGYYKLLLDFKMFDKDGTYLPQEAVIPEFDADLLHELTEKYVAGEKAKTEAESPAFQRALERVEAEVVGDDEGRMYSIDEDPDTAYLAAVERGDMVTAQRMVNEAAKKWGAIVDETTKTKRPLHLYHGSRDFGFTRFNERVIFATVKESVAAGYNSGVGLGRVRNASVKYIPNDGTAETAIKNARSVLGRDLKLLDDKAKQEIISKADAILKTVARKISDIDDAIDYGKAAKFFEYLAGKYGEDASMKWTNQLDNMKYMISGEYTAEEILEDGEWLEHDLEKYSEWKRSLNELWLEEREEIENATLGEAFRYVLGYDYGDKVIDIEFGLGRLLNEREKLVNPNGSLVYLDDIVANIEEKKSTGVYDLYGHAGEKPLIIDEGNRFWDAIPFDGGFRRTDYIVKWAKDHGYTSVNLKSIMDPSAGGSENVYADEWVFFSSDQVKSADPVTYDDNGNVIPLSERFKEDDSDIRYSIDETPETRNLTDREILGMALEGAVQSQEEYNIVKSYREQATLLELVREKRDGYIKEANELERQIKALRERMEDEGDPDGWIRKAMDDAIAKKRAAERMRDEQVKILDNADRELLRVKAAKPFREIVAREQKRVRAAEYKAERSEEKAEKARETTRRVREEYKEKIYKARRDATDYKRAVYRTAYEKAEEKNRAYRERTDRKADESRERKEMTARKRTIMRVLGSLQTKLVHPTKTNHAPKELHDLMQTVMRTADPKAWDANRKNIREMGDLAAAIEKLERQATRTAKEQELLDDMKSKYETLEQQTMPLAKQAQAMYAAYKKYNDTLPEDMRIPESVMTEMSEMIDKIEDVPLKEMGLESLKAVETFVKVLSYQINNANELFTKKRGEQVSDWGNAASREAAESKPLKWLSPKSMEIKNARDVREFLWKNMKPLTAFEAIGSPKLMELFQSVLDGEEVWITDVLEAREAIVKAKEKYGYDTWDLKTRREFTNSEGKTVRLTVGEMMSLYAYAKREQAMGHLRGGGFVLDAGATEITEKNKIRTEKMLNLTERYTMTEEEMGKLAGMLTEEQKQYATEIQDYLTSLGEKGNEISRKLYGLDLFNEEHYFPIKVKSEYLESQTGKTGDPKIKNRGMSKETVPDAQNPLVLQDFMTIVSGHVNDMATYHAFVLPVEDLTRVLNYQPSNAIIDEDGNWTEEKERKEYSTLKAVIESKYGAQANAYIEQLIRDLNGGARREAAANLIDKGITAFKRASTMASLSVLVQQPTSVFRAMAYVDPKHFRSLAALDIKGHKEAWEQVKKYAKVAAIKEMGGYDTGVGTRTADYLNSKDYKTWGERAKAFFLPDVYGGDSNYRAEIFGKGAAYADELAWIQMFDACKREQAEKLGKPMDSEEVLEAAGKRFTEVVRRTQVYDSTLTRSEYMRSKDTGMKMATAFMAEPTTVVSMMLDGLIRANRGDKAFLKKTAGAIAASVIFNALAVSLVYAARDDDEEKTYTEKYLATLATETAEGFNPLEYLPYTRDVMSLMKGYDIERTDMALFADLFKSFERITSSTRTPVEKTTEVAGAVASFFGVPIRNLVRDAMIPVNLVQSATSGERTTGKGISAAIADEFSVITNLFGADTTNAHQLYKAAKSGDQAHYDRVASRYKSEQAAEMALRTALRENDKRIAEAAEAKISGELEAYESIVEQIESEGRFDRNLIIRAINNEVLDIKDNADQVVIPEEEVTDEEDETTESLYNTSDLNAALTRGDREDFEDIYYYLLATKQEQGKTEAQAKAAVKSGITSYWRKQYLAAWEENNTAEMKRILELLEETELYGGYNDVATMAQRWIQES